MWPFKGKSKGEKIQVCEVAINTKTTNTKLDNFRIRRMQWTTRTTRSSRQRKIKKRPRRKLRLRMVVTLPTLCTISPNNWTWPKRHRWDEQVCLPYFGEIDKPTCLSFTCFLDLLLFNQVYSKIGRRNEPSQVSCLTALTTITILQDHHHHHHHHHHHDHRQG